MPSIDACGRSLHYQTPRGLPGAGDSESLVLIHGLGGSARHYSYMLPHLHPELRPILLDLPGHGESGGAAPPCVDALVSAVLAVVDTLGTPRRIHWVGHSLAGLVGLRAAQLHPDRLGALAMLASAPRFKIHPEFAAAARAGSWGAETVRCSFQRDVPDERVKVVGEDLLRLRLEKGEDPMERWGTLDMGPVLGEVQVPCLVVVPQADVIISPRKGRQMAAQLPHASLEIIEDAGHYVHVERPERVARVLNAFLGGLTGGEVAGGQRTGELVAGAGVQ